MTVIHVLLGYAGLITLIVLIAWALGGTGGLAKEPVRPTRFYDQDLDADRRD
jgi:hypothetical protein